MFVGVVCKTGDFFFLRYLTISGIRFSEGKKLGPIGISLSKLARFAGLEEKKSIFPFDAFKDVSR